MKASLSTIDTSGPEAVEPLPRTNLRDSATRVLRSQILAGRIAPGRLYAIGDIAIQLGTSPTPVREALLELANLGLVELVRNRGFRIQAISAGDLHEIMEMRMMLEVPAMLHLASMEKLPDLSEAIDLCDRGAAAAKQGDVMAYLALDRDFHMALLGKQGNQRLMRAVGTLRDQTRLYGIAHLEKDALEESAMEHKRILRALTQRHTEDVAKLVRAHLAHIVNEWGTPAKARRSRR